MDLELSVSIKVTQDQKDKYHTFSHMWISAFKYMDIYLYTWMYVWI